MFLAHSNHHQPFGCGKVLLMFDFSTTNLLNSSGLSITNLSKSSTEKKNLCEFPSESFPNCAVSQLQMERFKSQTVLWCAGIVPVTVSSAVLLSLLSCALPAMPALFCTRHGPLADRKASGFLSVLCLLLIENTRLVDKMSPTIISKLST